MEIHGFIHQNLAKKAVDVVRFAFERGGYERILATSDGLARDFFAAVVELADTLDLGSSGESHAGSSLSAAPYRSLARSFVMRGPGHLRKHRKYIVLFLVLVLLLGGVIWVRSKIRGGVSAYLEARYPELRFEIESTDIRLIHWVVTREFWIRILA